MPANPYLPYPIYGRLTGTGASSCTVYAKNRTTGETINVTPNSSGEYAFDCANFPSGYSNGDIINIEAHQGTLFAEMEFGAIAKTSSFNILETDEVHVE